MKILQNIILAVILFACSYSAQKQGYVRDIYYETYGNGDPIIFLHGGPGLDHNYFKPQMLELAKTNTLVFYDQRGSGKSLIKEINDKTINLAQFVKDLENLRKKLGYEKVTLMGHSWGGRLAIEYNLAYPEQVEKLILVNSSPVNEKGRKATSSEVAKKFSKIHDKIKAFYNYNDFVKLNEAQINEGYRHLFSTYFYKQEQVKKLNLDFTIEGARGGAKVIDIMSKELAKMPDLAPKLKQIKSPTLIIQSDKDIIPLFVAEEIKNAISGSELVIFKNCGHFPYIEQKEQFFEVVERFL